MLDLNRGIIEDLAQELLDVGRVDPGRAEPRADLARSQVGLTPLSKSSWVKQISPGARSAVLRNSPPAAFGMAYRTQFAQQLLLRLRSPETKRRPGVLPTSRTRRPHLTTSLPH
jgi:hypothetical protein